MRLDVLEPMIGSSSFEHEVLACVIARINGDGKVAFIDANRFDLNDLGSIPVERQSGLFGLKNGRLELFHRAVKQLFVCSFLVWDTPDSPNTRSDGKQR